MDNIAAGSVKTISIELSDLIIDPYIQWEREFTKEHPTYLAWSSCRGERVVKVANYCVKRWPGDLIEVGCLEANLTTRFAEIARDNGRRVIAIDPWIPGWGDCKEDSLDRFLENIREVADWIDIIRMKSQGEEAIRLIKERELCFAYINGEHTGKAVYSDILTVSHCRGIIAADDLYMDEVLEAFWAGAHALNRQVLHHPRFCEGYLLPRESNG